MRRIACAASRPPQPECRSRPHAQPANIVRGVDTLGGNQFECQRAEIVPDQTADCEMIGAAAGQGRERRSGHRGTRSAGTGPVVSRLPFGNCDRADLPRTKFPGSGEIHDQQVARAVADAECGVGRSGKSSGHRLGGWSGSNHSPNS